MTKTYSPKARFRVQLLHINNSLPKFPVKLIAFNYHMNLLLHALLNWMELFYVHNNIITQEFKTTEKNKKWE